MGNKYRQEGSPPQSTPRSPDGKLESEGLTVPCRARHEPLPLFTLAFFEPASQRFRSRHLIFLLYLVLNCGEAVGTDRRVSHVQRLAVRRELFEAVGVVGVLRRHGSRCIYTRFGRDLPVEEGGNLRGG